MNAVRPNSPRQHTVGSVQFYLSLMADDRTWKVGQFDRITGRNLRHFISTDWGAANAQFENHASLRLARARHNPVAALRQSAADFTDHPLCVVKEAA